MRSASDKSSRIAQKVMSPSRTEHPEESEEFEGPSDTDSDCQEIEQHDNEYWLQVQQSPITRRQIRTDLRTMYEHIKDHQLDYTDPKNDILSDKLQMTNEIFRKIKTTREGAIEARLVNLIAQCGKQKAQRLHTDFTEFRPDNFILKVVSHLSDGSNEHVDDDESPAISFDQWEAFGSQVQSYFKSTPPLNFMFGSFAHDLVRPPREQRIRRQKDKDSNVRTVPKQLKSLSEASTEGATTFEVEKIMKLLWQITEKSGHQPTCYFDFVVNPNSFSQTVENIFYTSFLVKDGHVRISLDEDKLPVIEPVSQAEGGDESDNLKRNQMIIQLTKGEWRDIVDAFHIVTATIPDRLASGSTNGKRNHDVNGDV